MKKVFLYDTTLRDGEQTEGVSFSVDDKIRVVRELDNLGIHFIEGGWPGSNPKTLEFFNKIKKYSFKNAKITAFSSTKRHSIKAEDDANLRSLLEAETSVITIFGKSWDFHVRHILKTTLDENLSMVRDTVEFLKSRGRKVFFDAEHFFDGYFSNPEYATEVILTAQKAGADAVVLCETNGGMLFNQVSEVVEKVRPKIKVSLGIHAHNDSAMGVANSIAAIAAGCDHVQGTINGLGERCGNADLCAIIANLKLKLGIDCISKTDLKKLTEISRFVAEICNLKQQPNQPYVGSSAFAHKAGVHVDAVMKKREAYEHIDPDDVGNTRRFLISELAGKSTVLMKAKSLNLDLSKDTPQTRKILDLLQDMEHKGYHFEAADASFEILMHKALGKYKSFFDLESFKLVIEKRVDSKTREPKLFSEASIKVRVNDIIEHTVAEGDGPINALDNALRKALKDFFPALSEMHLSDFKVRVLDEKAGTAAKVRVLIQSQDKTDSWSTIGVSENIIEASWQALADSVEYKLFKDNKNI
ncbi:MAG: citramalate synthase [Candidatus Omnitrophota bacterium]